MVKRKKKKLKIKIVLFNTLIFTLFIILNTNNALADKQSIQIYVEPEQVNENDFFKVSAYTITEGQEIEFLINVNITFNNQTYIITEENDNFEVEIKAPSVETDKTFDIYAIKQGYKTNYTKIKVKNIKPSLEIIPQDYIIPAGDYFYVTVYENNIDGNTVEGVKVYISNCGDMMVNTQMDGKAYLNAPKDRGEIKIIASKLGYINGNLTIKIKPQSDIISQIIHNKIFLIFLSFLVLIFAILFVHFRQKKNIYNHAKEISDKKTFEKYASKSDSSYDENIGESTDFTKSPVRVSQGNDGKVEEIRISRPNKEKYIVGIETQVNGIKEPAKYKNNKHDEDEWFEGIDDIRYEIDKLTGKIDEKGKDKWFEGVDDFKKKIDEKIKRKNKN